MERKIEKIRSKEAALQLISSIIEQNKYNTSNLISLSDRVYELENALNSPKLDNNLTNVNFTSLTNGDLIKYDGSNFINFVPTYLDGAGITDNYLIKVVGGSTVQSSFVETSTADTSTSLTTHIPLTSSTIPGLAIRAGSIETEFYDTNKTRMHLTSTGIANQNGITITSDGRVGIGVKEPEEDLHLDGNFQLDTGGNQRSKILFYDGQNQHEHAEIDALGEGTNGGALLFYTKVDNNGPVTEKLRINNIGAIGIGGANYGNSNQVLVSNGSGSAVSWADQIDTTYSAGTGITLLNGTIITNALPDLVVSLTSGGSTTITGAYPNFTISSTDTTYSAGTGITLNGTTITNALPDLVVSLTSGGSTTITGAYPNFTISSTDTTYSAGTGVSINGSNQISIGQNIGTDDSPTFVSIGLNKNYYSFPNPMPSISFNDTQISPSVLAKIEAENGTSFGGNLSFYTKRNTNSTYSGQLRKSLVLAHGGGATITSDSGGLIIETENGNEQGLLYNDPSNNYDFIIDRGGSEIQSRGILFKTGGGQDRMRITNDGKIGIGTNTPSEILDVHGNIHVQGNIQITNSSGTSGSTWSLEQKTVPAILQGNFQGVVLSDGTYSISWVLDNRMNMIYNTGMRMISGYDVSINTISGQPVFLNCYECRSSGPFIYTSDDNLKSYEEPLISATETLLKLKPKKYKKHSDLYTSEESPDLSGVNWHYEAGFIAQDVETIPELKYLVSEDEVNNHNVKSLCYNDIFVYLVKGFQEQQAEINLLKQEINNLKN